MTRHHDLTPGERLGAGREADVHAYSETAVVKLYHPGFSGHQTEATALRSLRASGVAPNLLNVVESDGRTGLVMQRLAGPDMLTLLQQQPWRLFGLAHKLASAHRAIHRIEAPESLTDLRQALTDRIADAGLPNHLRDFTSRLVDALPDGNRLCHGDYHPGNVILTPTGTAVIDWGAATRGAPEADHARTLLLLRRADPLPSTPLLSRTLIASGRSLLTSAYARTYRHGSPPLQHTASWLIVHTAARLSEGIPAERDTLLRHLERAQRKHEH